MAKNGGVTAGKSTPGHLGNAKAVGGNKKKTSKPSGGGGTTQVMNPGVLTPTVEPFMTAEDMQTYAQSRRQYEEGLNHLDLNYSNQVANTAYEEEQIAKGAVSSKAEANDDFAARGLFRSSVRDADLFDIDATAEMRKTFLDTQLNTLRLNTEAEKASAESAWNEYQAGVNKKEVENAQGVSATLPKYSVEPHLETVKKAGMPAPPKKTPAPTLVMNQSIGGSLANGGTTAPGSKPPPRPKAHVGPAMKVKGQLYG